MEAHSGNSNALYKECLRNHAASLGSYATDGCGEFTPDVDAGMSCLQCAACGCHRNFHRKASYCSSSRAATGEATVEVERSGRGGGEKKRLRSKFTAEQKEKMLGFAEKLGWRLMRRDEEDEVEKFCRGIGVTRQVFKVWMHNHKTPSHSSANASSLTTDR